MLIASAGYAPHSRNKAKPRDFAILVVSFNLFEKEDRVGFPDDILTEQVSFVYLCVPLCKLLGFLPRSAEG
jgi:hypothetical protein